MGQRLRQYPWLGLFVIVGPAALAALGSGIALAMDGTPAAVVGGIVTALVSPALVLPALFRRDVEITEQSVSVSSGVPFFRREVVVSRAELVGVRWEMKRPRSNLAGSSHAKSFKMLLVGPETPLVMPIRRYDVDEARQLGMTLGLPVERVVDGEIAERWDANGNWIMP